MVDKVPDFIDNDQSLGNRVLAAWLNDVNKTVYRALGTGGVAPATAAAIISNLSLAVISDLQAGTAIYVSTVGGSANAITLTPSPAISAYSAGQRFYFIAASTNTGTATVNINSKGAVAITKFGTIVLAAGDIRSGALIVLRYDGTQFQMDTPAYVPWTSFTPVITFATPGNLSVTYSAQVGRYTRTGNLVTVMINLVTSSYTQTTASGALQVTGLPLISGSTANARNYGSGQWAGITKANYTDISARVAESMTLIDFIASGSAQTSSVVVAADVPSAGTIILQFTISYEV